MIKFPVPILASISPVALLCHFASLCCAVPIFTKMGIAACHRVTMRVKGFRSCDNDSHILDRLATGVYRESVAPLILIWDRHMFHIPYIKCASYFI